MAIPATHPTLPAATQALQLVFAPYLLNPNSG